MAMMFRPSMYLQSAGNTSRRGIASDMGLARGYFPRYVHGQPPEPGDIPTIVKASDRHGFPDAISYGNMWILSPKLFAFFQEANGSAWPLRVCDITFRVKSGEEFPFLFLWGPPRFHRYNHDRKTYPHGKRPIARRDEVRWVESLGGDLSPQGRTMRPHRDGDPHFWEDFGEIEGDLLWGGDYREKYVSDALWERLNDAFPEVFQARRIAERDLTGSHSTISIVLFCCVTLTDRSAATRVKRPQTGIAARDAVGDRVYIAHPVSRGMNDAERARAAQNRGKM